MLRRDPTPISTTQKDLQDISSIRNAIKLMQTCAAREGVAYHPETETEKMFAKEISQEGKHRHQRHPHYWFTTQFCSNKCCTEMKSDKEAESKSATKPSSSQRKRKAIHARIGYEG